MTVMMPKNGHRFDPTILREYDIRGVVGETLSAKDAYGPRPFVRDHGPAARHGQAYGAGLRRPLVIA